MWRLETSIPSPTQVYKWLTHEAGPGDILEICFNPNVYRTESEEQTISRLTTSLKEKPIEWITPKRDRFLFNFDKLRATFDFCKPMQWLNGEAYLKPSCGTEAHGGGGGVVGAGVFFQTKLWFLITPEIISQAQNIPINTPVDIPSEIIESLKKFQGDHADLRKTAFVMMRFAETPAHTEITQAIKRSLTSLGIQGLRADDKEYHADLYYNVLTYLHGCAFGVAVFENIEQKSFSPNVSFEVGYMLAIGKSVCLLKDNSLQTLHTDLIGKLYRPFNSEKAAETIALQVSGWLRDKDILPL